MSPTILSVTVTAALQFLWFLLALAPFALHMRRTLLRGVAK
jgi:hypothetical protein